MSRSLYAKLHRRFGKKLSGKERFERAAAKQQDFVRWLNLAGVSAECSKSLRRGVAIVGGGFAGLAAAWCLGQKGVSSTVFEASGRVGGRVETDRSLIPGRLVEAGAELIGMNHPMWLEMAQRFGFALTVLTGEDQYAAMRLEIPLRMKGKPVTDLERLHFQMETVLGMISQDAKVILDAMKPWNAKDARVLDAKSVGDKLDQFVQQIPAPRHPMLRDALEVFLGNDNVMPTKQQSYLGLLALVKGGQFGGKGKEDTQLEGYWRHTEEFRCAEGNQSLADMMITTARKATTLKLNSPVKTIEIDKKETRVEVTWQESSGGLTSHVFDYAILAVPPTVWKHITIKPPLPPGNEMAHGPAVKYLSSVKSRFWIRRGTAPSAMSDELGMVWEGTDNQTMASQGVDLSVFAGGSFVPKEPSKAHFRNGLRNIYRDFTGSEIKNERVVDWPIIKWIETGYSCPGIGQVTTVAKFLSGIHKNRLMFAGEHTCMAYFGLMEGALQSGAQAAKAIFDACSPVLTASTRSTRSAREAYAFAGGGEGVWIPSEGHANEWAEASQQEPSIELGEQIVEAVESWIKTGESAALSPGAVLQSLLLLAPTSQTVEADREGIGYEATLSLQSPSVTTLFNSFVSPDNPVRPRTALQRHYSQIFKKLAEPGAHLRNLQPRDGDLILRLARGEGWGHLAIVASSGMYPLHRLASAGLRGEGYPLLRPGWYVHVVETYPRPHTLSDRFARRIADDTGLLLRDTLLLRPLATGGLSVGSLASLQA